jgi:hypothetical protein
MSLGKHRKIPSRNGGGFILKSTLVLNPSGISIFPPTPFFDKTGEVNNIIKSLLSKRDLGRLGFD